MKIKCKECGELVIEGDVKSVTKENGGTRTIFDTGIEKPLGTILKNNSGNPKDWTGLCSECQKLQNPPKVKK